MNPRSAAHELASHIHASFFGQNDNLTEQLTTSEFGEGGTVATMHIGEQPHPTNEFDKVEALTNSLFMRSLVDIALKRD
jgi:hypothetical protein